MLVNSNFNKNDDKYALKSEIPTSLPANGGNAETVDGYHIRCEDVATPNYNWFATFDNDGLSGISPSRAYVGNAGNANTANAVKTMSVIGTASDVTHTTVLDWANSVNGFGTAAIIDAYGYPSDVPVSQEGFLTLKTCYQGLRKIVTFSSYADNGLIYQRQIWTNEWRTDWYQTKAGNADTVDGLHANAFMHYEPTVHLKTSINDMTTPGTYGVNSETPDFPAKYGAWGLMEVRAFGILRYQTIIFETGFIISRGRNIDGDVWSDWHVSYTDAGSPIFHNYNLSLSTSFNQVSYYSNNDGTAKGLWFINHTSSSIIANIVAVAPAGAGPVLQYGYGTNSYPEIQDTGEGREWFVGKSLSSTHQVIQMTVPSGKLGYFGIYNCTAQYPAHLYGLHFT